MSIWEVAQCSWSDRRELDDYLADHWEPFVVTEAPPGIVTIWLRRSTERAAVASVAPLPRREHAAAATLRDHAGADLDQRIAELQERWRRHDE